MNRNYSSAVSTRSNPALHWVSVVGEALYRGAPSFSEAVSAAEDEAGKTCHYRGDSDLFREAVRYANRRRREG